MKITITLDAETIAKLKFIQRDNQCSLEEAIKICIGNYLNNN